MRIAIYCEPLGVRTSGNPGRGMLKALVQQRANDEFILVVRNNYQRAPELVKLLADLSAFPNCKIHVEQTSRRVSNLLALLRVKGYGKLNLKADLFVNMDCTALGSKNHPLITVLADLSVYKGNTKSSYSNVVSYLLRRFLIADGIKEADHVVVISNATRNDVIEYFPNEAGKLHIVYNGIEKNWFDEPDNDPVNKSSSYWIWWGHISSRKNLHGLITAYALLRKEMALPAFTIVYSNKEVPSDLVELVKLNGLESSIRFLKHLPVNSLVTMVASSQGLLFPSFIEGFGLPIIEAMATGVPVLTSSTSAMPEIAGNNAVLCNPNDIDNIKEGLKGMLDPSLGQRIRSEERKAWAKRFTYSEAARQFGNIIDLTIKENK